MCTMSMKSYSLTQEFSFVVVREDIWVYFFDELIFWSDKVTVIQRKLNQFAGFVDSQQLLREILSRCIIQQCNFHNSSPLKSLCIAP